MPVLSIVIPCYNSAENIADLQIALEALAKQINNYSLEIILVDDGSKDDTYNKLIQFSETTDLKIIIVKLTGNFGSYNTFLAGLSYGTGDVYAHMHPDMQDPPEHLVEMLNYYEKGIKFVIGQRVEREDKNFNQLFAHFYHWLIKKIGLTHIPEGGYDLILFDKALRNHVVNMNEKECQFSVFNFMAAISVCYGSNYTHQQKKGKSQWTFSKKSKLLFDSIVAFSYTPIRWMTYTSMFVFIASIVFFIYLLFSNKLSIYLSLILFFGNLILIFMSIVGEYLWRTLDAARNRPNFVVDKVQSNKS